MDTKIIFPALCISKSSIDKLNYQHFSSGKKFMSVAFKNVLIVDAQGNRFDIDEIEQCGGISFIDSIKNFGILFKVKPKLKIPVYTISVEEFRNKIASFLRNNPKMLLNMRISDVDELNMYHTYIGLINLF